MLTQEEFTARLRENQRMAAAHAAAILSAGEDYETVLHHTWGYVACKYLLDEAELATDDLIGLGNLSTERLAGLRRGGLEYADRSVGCTSVASSVTKKALLVLSLGKALDGLHFDPDIIAETATIPQLARLIVSMLAEKEA